MASSAAYGLDIVGRAVEVLWEKDAGGNQTRASPRGGHQGVGWYRGVVSRFDESGCKHLIEYDDGDRDWYDLGKIQFRLLEPVLEDEPSNDEYEEEEEEMLVVDRSSTAFIRNINNDAAVENDITGNEERLGMLQYAGLGESYDEGFDASAVNDATHRAVETTEGAAANLEQAVAITKTLEQQSLQNASGIYQELEATAQVLRAKSAAIQRRQTEQAKEIYRAQVMLSDEATNIANDVERRMRTETETLFKRVMGVSRRVKRDLRDHKELQKENASLRREVKMTRTGKSDVEKANEALKKKIANMHRVIAGLKKKELIHTWKATKQEEEQYAAEDKEAERAKLLAKKKAAAEKRKNRGLFESSLGGEGSGLQMREASILALLYTLVENARPAEDGYGIKVFAGIAATLDVLGDHSEGTLKRLLDFCWHCSETYEQNLPSGAQPLASEPGSHHLVQAILGLTNNAVAAKSKLSGRRNKFSQQIYTKESSHSPSFLRDASLVVPGLCPLLSDDTELVVLTACLLLRLTRRVEFMGAAVEALAECAKSDIGRRSFVVRDGMKLLMPVLNSPTVKQKGHSRVLASAVALLLAVVQEGPHLDALKKICATKEFFQHCADALTLRPGVNAHDVISRMPDLEVVEALSMLLEKMSRHAGYHKYFHAASLVPKLQEWVNVLDSNDDDDARFFVMNAKAIIKRLKRKLMNERSGPDTSSRMKLRMKKAAPKAVGNNLGQSRDRGSKSRLGNSKTATREAKKSRGGVKSTAEMPRMTSTSMGVPSTPNSVTRHAVEAGGSTAVEAGGSTAVEAGGSTAVEAGGSTAARISNLSPARGVSNLEPGVPGTTPSPLASSADDDDDLLDYFNSLISKAKELQRAGDDGYSPSPMT
jgi:hypothetical protein